MTEKIECNAKDILPLEGDIYQDRVKEKVFKNLSAMADYIKTFNVQSGRYQLCYTHEKQEVFVLQYERSE